MHQRALSAGAKSLREPADQPYSDRMCGVLDPFGYKLWFATHMSSVCQSTSWKNRVERRPG